jgi:hypothetical protein
VILIAIGLIMGVGIALDVQKSLRTASTATIFGAYSRQDRPTAFWMVCGIKALLSATLAILTALLIVRNPA